MINILINKLLSQANKIDTDTKKSSVNVSYKLIFITPKGNITSLGVDKKADYADFVSEHGEDMTVGVRLQPAVYYNELIPYRDNLVAQLVADDGTQRIVKEFTAIPLDPGNVKLAGEHSQVANIVALSETSLQSYTFQLLDPVFAVLRDQIVSGITVMGNVENTLSHLLNTYTQRYVDKLDYTGLIMESPVDNTQVYSTVIVPEGTPLIGFPTYLQMSEKYGVYSKGLGCFFKQKRWWVYSLYDTHRYKTHPAPVDIYRLPRDKVPTLDRTFFYNENGLTILATGAAEYEDLGDINKQDQGVGSRLIMPSRISGETGSYYNAGRSISTRADSMSEFQTSSRANGNNYTPVNKTPSGNPFKYASQDAANSGVILHVEWHNSDTGLLAPGVPCRYQYLNDNNMLVRTGIVLGYRTDYTVIDPNTLLMKRSTMLTLFLGEEI